MVLLTESVLLTSSNLALAGVCAFILFFCAFWIQKVQTKTFRKILQNCPCAWAMVSPHTRIVQIDENLCHLLKAPNRSYLSLNRFKILLGVDTPSLLDGKINDLLQEHKEFEIHLFVKPFNRICNIYGRLKDSENCLLWIQPSPISWEEHEKGDKERAALQKESETLNSLLNSIDLPLWQRNDKDELIYCNSAYAECLLSSPEQILQNNTPLWSNKGVNNTSTLKEEQHVILDGQRRLLEFREFNTENIFNTLSGYALDKTHQAEAQKQLARYVQSQREILDNISSGVSLYGPDKRIKYFNHSYVRMFGMDAEWLQTSPTMNEILENLRARRQLIEVPDFTSYKRRQLQNFSSLMSSFEEPQHLPDGRDIRVVVSPHPMGGLFYVFDDITDQRELERKFNTLIETHQTAINNLHEAVAVFGSDHRLKLTNPTFLKLWSLEDQKDLEGKHLSDLLEYIRIQFQIEKEWPDFKKKIQSFVADRQPKNKRFRRRDGKIIELTHIPLPDGGTLMSHMDVTASESTEKILKEKNEVLKEADRLKSRFIENVSKELKTPLNAIVGFSEMLDGQYVGRLSKKQSIFTNKVLQSARSLSLMVTDLLELSDLEAGKLKPNLEKLEVKPFLKSLFQSFEEEAKRSNITLSLRCQDSCGSIMADSKRLEKAFHLLIQKTLETSTPGEDITLSVVRRPQEVLLTLTESSQNSKDSDQTFLAAPPKNKMALKKGITFSLAQKLIEFHQGTLEFDTRANSEGKRLLCRIPINLISTQNTPYKDGFQKAS